MLKQWKIRRTETVCLCVALVGCLLSTSPVKCPPAGTPDNCQPRKQNKPSPEEECVADLEPSLSYYDKFEYNLDCKGITCDLRHDCGRAPLNAIRGDKFLPYIINGQRQHYGAWPSFATHTYMPAGRLDPIKCGAVIISPKHILTLAQCVAIQIDDESFEMPVENLFITLADDTLERDRHEMNFGVRKVCLSKSWKEHANLADWAVIELNDTIKFNQYIQPACLPYKPDYEPRRGQFLHCFVMGWGVTDPNATPDTPRTPALMDMPLTFQPCKVSFKNPTTICGKRKDKPGAPCFGDRGGPILCKNPRSNRWTVVGLAHQPGGCSEAYSNWQFVATDVRSVLDDIKNNCSI